MKVRSNRLTRVAAILGMLMVVAAAIVIPTSAQGRAFTPAILNSTDCTITVNSGGSISSAISSAPSGAVICVRSGVYNEQVRLTSAQSGLTVKAYPGDSPIIDGQGTIPDVTGSNRYAGLVQISGSNILVEGFEVRNSAGRGVTVVHQSSTTQITEDVTVRNMKVHHSWDSGINVNGNSDYYVRDILIEGNTVYSNLQKNLNGETGGSGLTFIEAESSVARGNTIYNNYGEGLVSGRYTRNLTLEDNVSYDNDNANIYLINTTNPLVQRNFVFCTNNREFWRPTTNTNTSTLKAGTGLQVRDESFPGQSTPPPPSSGQIIINNIVVGCGTNFGVASQVTGGGLTNAVVANNTFVNARGDTNGGVNNVLLEGRATYRNSKFVNNLMLQTTPGTNLRMQYSQGTPDLSTFTVGNNLFWPEAPGTSWYPNEAGRVVADPLLVNPVLPELSNLPDPAWYGPRTNSPVINAGQSVAQVTVDFFSRNRVGTTDIGAVEFAATADPGRILITVQTSPAGALPLFSFASSYSPGSFQLSAGQTHDSGPLDAGTYGVTMSPFPGWTLTSATCDDGSNPDAIGLASGETVACTFVNTEDQPQTGTIIVRKETSPDGATEQFNFTTNYGPGFQLADGQSNTSDDLSAGIYSVQEASTDGWTLTSATCDDGSDPAAVNLSAGETVTCTFVNTEDQVDTGTIIVRKETVPDGSAEQFTFTADYSADFQLADGQDNTSAALPPGTYAIQETAVDGWTLTNATCDDGSDPAAIGLSAGEIVTCTFVNTQDAPQTGTIIVRKETVPNGMAQQFSFTMSYGASVQLGDGQSHSSGPLAAGTYSVQEASSPGWTLTSASCDDGSNPSDISLSAGETVTCTFINTQDPPSGSSEMLYVSTKTAGSVDGLTYGYDDILAYDTGRDQWSIYLDLSDVGVSRNLNGFMFLDDGSVLLTFGRNQSLAGLGTVASKDIVRFVPSSTGENTAGTFEWYLDGSDVGLTTSGEVIDALALAPDGRLLISTTGTATVKNGTGVNFKARDEDLIVLSPTSLGQNTAGHWDLYFDGSSVNGLGVEDVAGAWFDAATGDLYLTVTNSFNLSGVKGNARDIFRLSPVSGGYQPQLYWSGPDHGFGGVPNAFEIVR